MDSRGGSGSQEKGQSKQDADKGGSTQRARLEGTYDYEGMHKCINEGRKEGRNEWCVWLTSWLTRLPVTLFFFSFPLSFFLLQTSAAADADDDGDRQGMSMASPAPSAARTTMMTTMTTTIRAAAMTRRCTLARGKQGCQRQATTQNGSLCAFCFCVVFFFFFFFRRPLCSRRAPRRCLR